MDRKGIIAITLAIVTLFGWTFYNQRQIAKARAAHAEAVAAEAERAKAAAPLVTPGTTVAPAVATPPIATDATPAVEEKTATLANGRVEYLFSNLGGGIARSKLRTHESERGRKMEINEFGATPIGAVTELPDQGPKNDFTMQLDEAAGVVAFERTDARGLQLAKKFFVTKSGDGGDEYTTKLEVTFTNRGTQPIALPSYFIHAGSAAPVHQADLPTYTGIKASGDKFVNVGWFSGGGFLFWSHPERPVFTQAKPNITWLGVTNQYFSTVVSPIVTTQDAAARSKELGASIWAKRFDISDAAWQESGRSTNGKTVVHHAVEGALGMPGFTIEPGKSHTQSFALYSGPREYSRLQRLPSDEQEIMDFGMFGFVSKALLNSMNWLHARLGSYALAIIVLTLCIKTLLWPLQNKATQSMKKMGALQPKMTELREKYSDDPQRMNTEIMKLYKDYGINPLSGCLPMLVQIPIFFGFYNMLGKAVELRNSSFLWVRDLSQPDTIAHIAGFPVNILPLVMAGTMFWQMAISPKSGDATQQKVFMFMPIIFIVMCYNFASALALYWTVQNLFSVAQLYATRNQAPPELVKVTAPRAKKK
jgi:YidC/Oxa1 family membrane protein insertase